MDINKLNLLYFLIYTEIILLIFGIIGILLNGFVSIFSILFNIRESKGNFISLLTEIPPMFCVILTIVNIAQINTSDKSYACQLLYLTTSAILIIIYRIFRHIDLNNIAVQRLDNSLYSLSKKFLKFTSWAYFLFFLLVAFKFINSDNHITSFCINIINWTMKIKFIGWLLPWVGGLILIVSTIFGLVNSKELLFRRKQI